MQSNNSDVINIIKKIIYLNDIFVNYSLIKWDINKLLAERIDYDLFWNRINIIGGCFFVLVILVNIKK